MTMTMTNERERRDGGGPTGGGKKKRKKKKETKETRKNSNRSSSSGSHDNSEKGRKRPSPTAVCTCIDKYLSEVGLARVRTPNPRKTATPCSSGRSRNRCCGGSGLLGRRRRESTLAISRRRRVLAGVEVKVKGGCQVKTWERGSRAGHVALQLSAKRGQVAAKNGDK